MKYSELKSAMRDFNNAHGIERKVDMVKNVSGQLVKMVGQVIISNNYFTKEYSVEERTYHFDNYNKALCANDGGFSIFGICDFDGDSTRLEYLTDSDVEYAEVISVVE